MSPEMAGPRLKWLGPAYHKRGPRNSHWKWVLQVRERARILIRLQHFTFIQAFCPLNYVCTVLNGMSAEG